MIYSRFGTRLTPIDKQEDGSGRITIQATVEGAGDPRSYLLTELKADDGMTEINEVVSKLPWRTPGTQQRNQKLL
jgi:hypothetical protein